jgi:iron complex transport system ATP-binding protein
VLGANGAGKTTLLRVLSGALKPWQGSVTLAGRPLAAWAPREQARLRALLPQDSQLGFAFSALEVVLLGRFPHHGGRSGPHDERIAMAALARTGGERARVQLARVLAQVWEPWQGRTRCLLLDEPIAALDIAHQHATLALARELAAGEGMCVVAVLHDLNLALQYADVVTLLHAGRVHACGRPSEVISRSALRDCFGLEAELVQPAQAAHALVLPRARTALAAAGG